MTCIVPSKGAALTEDEIRQFSKESLASYKVPRRVLFFDENELEFTGNFKIKLSELRDVAVKALQSFNRSHS